MDLGFVNSDGVLVTIENTSSPGWAAFATHQALGALEGCDIFYGTAAAPSGPATPVQPGEIACVP